MADVFSYTDNVELPPEAQAELAELERELKEGALRLVVSSSIRASVSNPYNFRRFIFHIGENHSGSGLSSKAKKKEKILEKWHFDTSRKDEATQDTYPRLCITWETNLYKPLS